MGRAFLRSDLVEQVGLLNAMRGLAALLVVLAHADAYYFLRFDMIGSKEARLLGNVGVYLFFVLSGFLIWSSAAKCLPLRNGLMTYAVHRITRVAPLYYLSIALTILATPLFWASFRPSATIGDILLHAVFAQTLVPGVSRTINPVLWTLTFEMMFYALVPVLFAYRKWMPALLALIVVASIPPWLFPLPGIGTFVRVLPMFGLGIFLAHYRLIPTWPAVAITCTIACAATTLLSSNSGLEVTSMAVAAAIFFGLARLGWHPLLLPFSGLGIISYSVYIWHYLLVEWLGGFLAYLNWPIGLSRSMIYVSLCLGLSCASYVLVEAPGMTTLRHFLLRWVAARSLPAMRPMPPTAH